MACFVVNQQLILFLVLFCAFGITGASGVNEADGETHLRSKRAAVGLPDNLGNSILDNNIPRDGVPRKPESGEPPAKPKERIQRTGVKIAKSPECEAEVTRFCPERANSNNFLVLDCLQDDDKTDDKLSDECHHFLWLFKLNLTRDIRFDQASYEACAPEIDKIQDCKTLPKGEGKIIPCLIENFHDVTSKTCEAFLNKMASIVFSDFRLMEPFVTACHDDIQRTACGRLEAGGEEENSAHSQGQTVQCLNKKRKVLSKECKKSLNRVAEMQSDDFHMDRPLYYACRMDRENLCHDVVAGGGAVFKCLYKQLGDTRLSEDCRAKVEARQASIAEDVKADKTFYDACHADIKENECTTKGQQKNSDGTLEEDLSRSTILLCLEEAQNNGKKVRKECLQEMFELRSELMQDYKISPELVSACESEIRSFCSALKPGGNTIECLMKKIMAGKEEDSISPACFGQIRSLLHVANPGEDIRLDRPLQSACGDVVTQVCSDRKAGDGDVITCLLENLDHEEMTDECEDHLLEIQYFAVRDFKLDFHLFKNCRHDASTLCNADDFHSPHNMNPEKGPLIFSCLHHHLRSDDPNVSKPSRPCMHEIIRVMRERSMRIKLMPEVEGACLKELADLCSSDDEHTEVNGEMDCLQVNLDSLTGECRNVVANFTMEETEDLQLDRVLMRACTPMLNKFCNHLLEHDAMPNDVLDCLIEHKNRNDMDEKCAAGIEHHQIISMKDFRFNQKFREACQKSVAKFCKNKRNKYDVVACLSQIVRDDILKDQDDRVDKRCQKQIRYEVLQRGESINLDPDLKKQCLDDIHKFCNNKKAGEGEVQECLRSHKKKLSEGCHKLLFKREKDEAFFGDYTLHHACKKMIQDFCSKDGADEADIMDCLKEHRNDHDFDEKCRQVVQRRLLEQSQDFRLNPNLEKACKPDILKFCSHLYNEKDEKKEDGTTEKEMDGVVIDCLKKKFASKSMILSRDCEHEIRSRVREAALSVGQNPVLVKTCKEDIKHYCVEELTGIKNMVINEEDDIADNDPENGNVVECLKRNFRLLKSQDCKKEVAFMIAESRVDVHVDPLLHATCQKDLISLCRTVEQGQGRQMSCLLSYLEDNPDGLTGACRNMLKRRKDLWEYAAQVAPAETFSDIYSQMSASPARNYFFAILFTAVGIIFIVGLTCGRVTKRIRAELKNK